MSLLRDQKGLRHLMQFPESCGSQHHGRVLRGLRVDAVHVLVDVTEVDHVRVLVDVVELEDLQLPAFAILIVGIGAA